MRILIDECIDERFRNSLPGHDCQTARYAGLAGLTNGGEKHEEQCNHHTRKRPNVYERAELRPSLCGALLCSLAWRPHGMTSPFMKAGLSLLLNTVTVPKFFICRATFRKSNDRAGRTAPSGNRRAAPRLVDLTRFWLAWSPFDVFKTIASAISFIDLRFWRLCLCSVI